MANDQEMEPAGAASENDALAESSLVFVDDEAGILASLRSLFRKEGYILECFTSPLEALEYIKVNPADIVVSDVRMPDMGGIDFLTKVSVTCPEAVRVLLSGFEDKELVLNALIKGLAQHYILKPWDNASFRMLVRQMIKVRTETRRQHLLETLSRFQTLPSSTIRHKLLWALLSDRENSLPDLVHEVEKSPALVAKLLRVANSVFFGARSTISTVREAMVFIGTEYVASLLVAIETFHSISGSASPVAQRHVEELWARSVRRATIARDIARIWPGNVLNPHAMYTVALLLDIGLVVRACSDTARFERYQALVAASSRPGLDAERHVFAVPHAEVGKLLLQMWNFPPTMTSAIERHHDDPQGDSMVMIMQLADALETGKAEAVYGSDGPSLFKEWSGRIAIPESGSGMHQN